MQSKSGSIHISSCPLLGVFAAVLLEALLTVFMLGTDYYSMQLVKMLK
jgi:hypothetical protein